MSQSASNYYTTSTTTSRHHHLGKPFDSSSQERSMNDRMPTFHKSQFEGQRPSQSQFDQMPERYSPGSLSSVRGRMPPPPILVDPDLDNGPSWNKDTLSYGLEHVLPPVAGPFPPLSERPAYPYHIGGNFELPMQDIQLPCRRQDDLDSTPIGRFYEEPGPWNPQKVVGQAGPPSSALAAYPSFPSQINRLAMSSQIQPRSRDRSEVGSSTTGRNPLDSGYDSKSYATQSVRSCSEYLDRSQDCQSLVSDVGDLQMHRVDQFQGEDPESLQNESRSYGMNDRSSSRGQLLCPYPDCKNLIFKNQSDQKKHEVRHTKPFKCKEINCPNSKGFSTKNDLDRHKKSVHKINVMEKSYRCAAVNCPKKEKIWPRPDNFRQHCKRMHRNVDSEELLRISEITGFSLRSHGVDALAKDSELFEAEDKTVRAPEFTNLHSLQKVPTNLCHTRRSGGPNDSFHTLIGPLYSQSRNSCIEPPSAAADQMNQSSCESSMNSGRPTKVLPSIADAVPMQSLNSSESLCDSPPERECVAELSTEVAKFMTSKAARTMSVQADEVSRKIASDVVNRMRMSSSKLAEIQSILKSNFISLFGGDGSPRKRSPEDAFPPENTDTQQRKRVACDQCPKTMIRRCDLKKHQKRHSRPYGCTYTSCDKSFGSKNDWKRHENTQHYQVEAWRCREESLTSKIGQCAKVVHRREQFQAHLKEHHHINDEDYIRTQTKRNRIGRNGQCGFWCGFCREIITLKKRGLEAWDERFSHIDDLHFKKGETIDSWLPLDQDVPKGFLRIHGQVVGEGPTSPSPPLEEISESTETEVDEEACAATSEISDGEEEINGWLTPQQSPRHSLSRNSSPSRGNDNTATPPPHVVDHAPSFSEHEQQQQRLPPSKKGNGLLPPRQMKSVWYCCSCMNGPHNCLIDLWCSFCQEKRCESCMAQ